MNSEKSKVLNKITNDSVSFIALLSIPLNIIIYFALRESEYQLPRYLPPIMGIISILLFLLKNMIEFKIKIRVFILLLFSAGCYNLLLGLIDLASLWFVLAIIYSLLISKKNEAFWVFVASFITVLITGILMITKSTFIPLKYNFETCQFACVAVRILHFLLIGSLVFYILKIFFSTIQKNLEDLQKKSDELEKLNYALKQEMIEKKEIQQKMIDIVIQTEEKERKRLASDLHDGLGPVLSAINLYFQAYIDETNKDSKNAIESKLRLIIDNAAGDVSRISHNISPFILEKFGLVTALENFINILSSAEKIKFNLEFPKFDRLILNQELIIYRSITELINNSLKHSEATQISIQLKVENGYLFVDYSDNGKGFDVNSFHQKNAGIGLMNIQNRIQTLNGSMKLFSEEQKGMSANFSIPIKFRDSVEN